MKPADRAALVDRLARGLAWCELREDERIAYRRQAADAIQEIEVSDEQLRRIGWILYDPDQEPAEPGEVDP